jgi:VCBS repeat-containing protein
LSSGALLLVQANGGYRYDPNGKFKSLRAGQTATDSFTYTMADAAGATSSATVTITIQGANDAPLAVNDTGLTDESTVLIVSAAGILSNDTDPDSGDTKTVTAINGQAAAIGTQIVLASGALLKVKADGSYQYDPNGRFNYLLEGQLATDTFDYTMADGTGATSTATVTITVQGVGALNSVSGYVYLDVNNNGSRGSQELGLPQVIVVIQGPVNRLVRSDATGYYEFIGLPSGTYTVWESHPASFLDGIDSLGTPALGTVGNDRFTNIALAGDVHLVNYNFGERGVLNPTKALELASTPAPVTMATVMVMKDEPDSLQAQILQSITPPPAITTQSLDVDRDGHIAAIDVLLVINYINATGHQSGISSFAAPSVGNSTPNHCDVDQDGVVSASDVLAVINYINAHPSRGEAEADNTSSMAAAANTASDPEMDLLVDLLASDVAVASKKRF